MSSVSGFAAPAAPSSEAYIDGSPALSLALGESRRLRLRTILISTRHLFTSIRARDEIVSAFVWVPPATVRNGYHEVDANALRGRLNLP
jgi:hypothetical protein